MISAKLRAGLKSLINETTQFLKLADNELLLSKFKFSSDCVTINMRTAFDEDASLYDYLTSSSVKIAANSKIKFQALAVDKRISDFSEPLIILFDSAEPDRYSADKLLKRCENGLKTYPIVIFPDEFFELAQGEKLSYIDICDTVENYTQAGVIPLRHSDIMEKSPFVASYICYIDNSVRLDEICRLIDMAMESISLDLNKLVCGNNFEQLVTLAMKKARFQTCIRLRNKKNEVLVLAERWRNMLALIREEYDRHILEMVTRKHYNSISPMAVRLNLKYNTNAGDIIAFAEKVVYATKNEQLVNNPVLLRESTLERLESEATDLAFIGTFSSGKTTLINALLGLPHGLPTSARHNTAVLTYIGASRTDYDQYTMEYGSELVWNIVSFMNFENQQIRNPFKGSAKVLSIRKSAAEGYIVILRELASPHDQHQITISSAHKLNIEEGCVVESGKSLIKASQSDRTAQLCSYDEMDYILKIIRNKTAKDLKLNLQSVTFNEIKKLFDALASFYKNQDNHRQVNVKLDELMKCIDTKNIPCEFSCRLIGIKDSSVKLDSEQKWTILCGDPNAEIEALCEKPECYMTAKRLCLYLNSEFLKYSTLVDTPGFGSVTEEHDNITERFIRDNANNLVVMIAIDKHTNDVKFTDLINNLGNIYKSYKNGQQKNVRFILNCFTNVFGQTQVGLKQYEKKVREISALLLSKDFLRENIFACNLKKAIFDNVVDDIIAGLGTFSQFKKQCLEDLPISAFREKFLGIQCDWKQFFQQNLQNIENQLYTFKNELLENEDAEELISRRLNNVTAVELAPIEPFISQLRYEFDEIYESLEYAFTNNHKHGGFLWLGTKRFDAVMEVFNNQLKGQLPIWENKEEDITDKFSYAMNELINASGEILDYNTPSKPRQHLIVVSDDAIKSLLIAADDDVGVIKRSDKTEMHMEKLKRQINTDFSTSKNHINEYYTVLKKSFDELKRTLINQLKVKLNALTSKQNIQDEIQRLESLRDELSVLSCEFKAINFNV